MRTSRLQTCLRSLTFCLAAVIPVAASAAPAFWEPNFGQPLGTLTGQDDAEQIASLGFLFPFANATYSSVSISTNGFINLGATANDPCCAAVPALLSSSSPLLAPFYADLDLLNLGTIYFNNFGNRAVITWDHVGSYASPNSPFTFQLQLTQSGSILFSYFGISNIGTALDGDLLVGLSAGHNAANPGASMFSPLPLMTGTTVYQDFQLGGGPFTLDNKTIQFTPSAGGFAVSQVPEPSSFLLLSGGFLAAAIWRFKFFQKRTFIQAALVGTLVVSTASAFQVPVAGQQPDGSYLLNNGQPLQPAGTHINVNDRPLGMVVSPDGKLLAVVTGSNFNTRALHVIDIATKTLKQTLTIGSSFVGVDFTKDGNTIYVGGGSGNNILIFTRTNGGPFAASGTIPIAGAAPSGLMLNGDDSKLYVALNLAGTVAVINTATRTVTTQVRVGTFPYTTVVSRDGSKVYVSNWGGRVPGPNDTTDGVYPVVVDPRTGIPASGTVSVIDTGSNQVVKTITVGLHPCGMALSPSGNRLYVTNANSDTVSVIDTASDVVAKVLTVGLTTTKVGQTKSPVLGSTPNAVAVSPDGGTLYVANATDNAIAVIDPESATTNPVHGLIPTGWYPTAVATDKTGQQLFVANGYGFGSIAPAPAGQGRSYTDRNGVVSILDVPNQVQLGDFTRVVRQNNHVYPPNATTTADLNNPIPMNRSNPSPIHHVFYVIKENRTYDQVFGDLPQGNGDPTLVQFGRNVTPNLHALAENFVLLDNFYGPGDQSALGHRWCLQAYASDYVHKYSNDRNDQNPMLLGATEAIYDNAKANGLTAHSFGERGLNVFSNPNATWTDVYNDWKNKTSNVLITPHAEIVGLRDIYDTKFPAYELRVPDQYRAEIFLQQFADYQKNDNLPNLVLILLPQDHTNGTSPGYPTPRAMNADNDLAVGRVVEAISNSKYWKDSAIFITEDDSQDGVDHVDGHRTVGLVISPYTRTASVDHSFYTIINMYKTIEQILGLQPLNQFDLAAAPMFSSFTSTPDFTPYAALPNQIALDEMNPSLAGLRGLQRSLAIASMKNNTSEADSAPADLMNRAIWHSVKGYKTPYNFGRPQAHTPDSFLTLLKLAGS